MELSYKDCGRDWSLLFWGVGGGRLSFGVEGKKVRWKPLSTSELEEFSILFEVCVWDVRCIGERLGKQKRLVSVTEFFRKFWAQERRIQLGVLGTMVRRDVGSTLALYYSWVTGAASGWKVGGRRQA